MTIKNKQIKTKTKTKTKKAIAMMRGKSSPSEHVLKKINSNNSMGFKEDLEMEIISFFVKLIFWLDFFTLILIKTTKLSNINNNQFLKLPLVVTGACFY